MWGQGGRTPRTPGGQQLYALTWGQGARTPRAGWEVNKKKTFMWSPGAPAGHSTSAYCAYHKMGAPTYGFLWEGLECMVENGVVGATTHNIVNVAPQGRFVWVMEPHPVTDDQSRRKE